MAITISSREFNQKASQVLKMSETEPVFITKWGKVVSVLTNYQTYQKQDERTAAEVFCRNHPAADLGEEMENEFEAELDRVRKSTIMERAVEFDE